MERVWQWLWDRFGAHYAVVPIVVGFLLTLQVYLPFTLAVVVREGAHRYVLATVATVVAVLVFIVPVYVFWSRPLLGPAQHFASGRTVDLLDALERTSCSSVASPR